MALTRRRRAAVVAICVLVGGAFTACDGDRRVPPPTGDRVLLIGVDGASWNVMRPLMAAGKLPTFSRLVAEGWSGPLRSIEPILSPAIWTTVATGKMPDQHGIHGFLADGDAAIPVTSNLRRSETLWTILSAHARRVNVVGWYVTWPTEPVNGVMVSDRFIPEEHDGRPPEPSPLTADAPGVYPAALVPELSALFASASFFLDPRERVFHEMFKAYPVDASRTAIAEWLMERQPADLTMVYLWGTDRVQHLFWKYYEPESWAEPLDPLEVATNADRIPVYYERVDGFLARLVARLGPRDTVLIVSDHGFGPAAPDAKGGISGDHRLDGIIIAAGNHVRPGRTDSPPSVADVAPTVLYLLGLPVGADMQGTVIRELIDPAFLAAHAVQTIASYERTDRAKPSAPVVSPMDESITRQLRALGYVE